MKWVNKDKEGLFVRDIEEMSLNAHPALNTMYYDGWCLRFGGGYTNRANSVNVLGEAALPVEDKVKYCEAVYTKLGLATVFKITPLSVGLDVLLEERGYSVVTRTNLMVRDISSINNEGLNNKGLNAVVNKGINEEWQRAYFRLNGLSEKSARVAEKIQGNIVNDTLCAMVTWEDEIVACGLGVIENGYGHKYVGLYDIVVSEKHRRKGLGWDICTSLLVQAGRCGADKAYLQVVADNDRAVKLYQKLGFVDQYQYWYRVKKLREN